MGKYTAWFEVIDQHYNINYYATCHDSNFGYWKDSATKDYWEKQTCNITLEIESQAKDIQPHDLSEKTEIEIPALELINLKLVRTNYAFELEEWFLYKWLFKYLEKENKIIKACPRLRTNTRTKENVNFYLNSPLNSTPIHLSDRAEGYTVNQFEDFIWLVDRGFNLK